MKLREFSWARGHYLIITACSTLTLLFFPYAFASANSALPGAWPVRLRILITLIMTSGASFILAALLGFIFAVGRETDRKDAAVAGWTYGSNLNQLSNWLTALVVGISLVKFEEIGSGLQALSTNLAKSGTSLGTEWPLVLSIILFYSSCGFITGVLFTLLELPALVGQSSSSEGGVAPITGA